MAHLVLPRYILKVDALLEERPDDPKGVGLPQGFHTEGGTKG